MCKLLYIYIVLRCFALKHKEKIYYFYPCRLSNPIKNDLTINGNQITILLHRFLYIIIQAKIIEINNIDFLIRFLTLVT